MRVSFLLSLFSLFFSFFFFISCKEAPKPVVKETSVNEIINADLAFSDMSKQSGMKNAFIDYMDNEGVLLRPGHLPVKGADAIDFLSQVNDTSYTVSWVPEGAQIAKSGELGFTYGVYTLEAADTILKGTYVSIWKKQADGKWKFVMNTSNEGIKPEK
ncbi:MAG: hypothetical protein M3015_08435 [Bacteroidota bacterium]|nr:hypothetical protein [Bacteroidota bacterium]